MNTDTDKTIAHLREELEIESERSLYWRSVADENRTKFEHLEQLLKQMELVGFNHVEITTCGDENHSYWEVSISSVGCGGAMYNRRTHEGDTFLEAIEHTVAAETRRLKGQP